MKYEFTYEVKCQMENVDFQFYFSCPNDSLIMQYKPLFAEMID